MSDKKKSLYDILQIPEASRLDAAIAAKGRSPVLDGLGDPERALRFVRAQLRGSYLFARFAVPSYASAVFSALTHFHPVDDALGPLVSSLVDVVRGELFNNNVFGRPGACHAHFHDMLEAYEAAGGDMAPVEDFLSMSEIHDFGYAIMRSELWSPGSRGYANELQACCRDPLALFILMPANELLAPAVYQRALASLSREPRFAKFRQFLERHVDLDGDDHGPTVMDLLDLYARKFPCGITRRFAASQVLLYMNG